MNQDIKKSRKDRIERKIRNAGYTKVSDFLLKVIREANLSENPYDYLKKNKANYTKAFQGNRSFKESEILAIEKLLSTSLYDLLSDRKTSFIPRGIRYIAFNDDPGMLTASNEELAMIRQYDEYDKNILDYVLEFESKNLFAYLVERKFLQISLECKDFNFCNLSIDESKNNEIISLASLSENTKTFNTLFNPINIIVNLPLHQKWMLDNSFYALLIQRESLLLNLFRGRPMRIKLYEINDGMATEEEGLFVPPILMLMLSKHFSLLHENEELSIKILQLAIKANSIISQWLEEKSIDYSDLTKDGLIKSGTKTVGSLYTCNIEHPSNIKSAQLAMLIKALNDQANTIKFSLKAPFTKARLENGYVVKQESQNKIEYEFLKTMEMEGYDKVPKYLGTQDGLDRYSFISGKPCASFSPTSDRKVWQVLKELKKIKDYGNRHLGNGLTYVHGELTPQNVLFKDEKLTGIINWDHCFVGKDYYDFIYLFWVWEDVGSYLRDNEKLFRKLLWLLDAFEAPVDFRKNLADKMIDVMESQIQKIPKSHPHYGNIYQWVKWSEIWVELFREKINRETGCLV